MISTSHDLVFVDQPVAVQQLSQTGFDARFLKMVGSQRLQQAWEFFRQASSQPHFKFLQ